MLDFVTDNNCVKIINTYWKIYKIKFNLNTCEISPLLSSTTVCTLRSLVSQQRVNQRFSFLNINCCKTSNMRNRTEIVNLCIKNSLKM